jgi:hypothetical protein
MAHTVFPTFQTQYILEFSSASRSREHWDLSNTEIFLSKDVALGQVDTYKHIRFYSILLAYNIYCHYK